MKTLSISTIILAVTFFFSTQVSAQFTTLQVPTYVSLAMNNVPQNLSCGKTWTENNATFQIVQTGNEVGCPGYCYAQSNGTSLWLAPAQVKVDLKNIFINGRIQEIYIEVNPYNGVGGTKAALIAQNGQIIDLEMNAVTGRTEVMILQNPNKLPLSHIMISSCESEVLGIGIVSENYIPDEEIPRYPQTQPIIHSNTGFNNTIQFNGGF